MPRIKLARKSTSVDMTAMCDVAFLLLSFFILVAHPKKPSALQISNPSSVYTHTIENKDVVMVTLDKAGKVYFSLSDEQTDRKPAIIDRIDADEHLGLTDAEKPGFQRRLDPISLSLSPP